MWTALLVAGLPLVSSARGSVAWWLSWNVIVVLFYARETENRVYTHTAKQGCAACCGASGDGRASLPWCEGGDKMEGRDGDHLVEREEGTCLLRSWVGR